MTLVAIDHVQLAMPPGGEDRARSFWGGLLGLTETPKPAALASRGGCWFGDGPLKIHCGTEDPFHPARKAHIAFRVDDLPGLADRARAQGCEVVDDLAMPGAARAFIFDPFGNRLEFIDQPILAPGTDIS